MHFPLTKLKTSLFCFSLQYSFFFSIWLSLDRHMYSFLLFVSISCFLTNGIFLANITEHSIDTWSLQNNNWSSLSRACLLKFHSSCFNYLTNTTFPFLLSLPLFLIFRCLCIFEKVSLFMFSHKNDFPSFLYFFTITFLLFFGTK